MARKLILGRQILDGWRRLLNKLFNWIPEDRNGRLSKSFFAFTLFVFLSAQVYLSLQPMLARKVPVEADDAYGYILKAARIRSSCLLQDCSALTDLRNQFLAPTSDPDVAYIRLREYQRVFLFYHPLHSIILLGFKAVGMSYEAAYNLIAMAGKLLICLGIAYWLFVIYGREAAGVALLLLSPLTFPSGGGLQTIIPGSMALGIAIILWGLILANNRYAHWTLLPAALAMLLLHPIGKTYTSITILLYWLKSSRPFPRRAYWISGIALFLLLSSFVIPLVVHQPELSYRSTGSFSGHWDYLQSLIGNFKAAFVTVKTWASSFSSYLITGGLVILGFLSLPTHRRFNWVVMGLLLGFLLLLGAFWVTPWYNGTVFFRLWVPAAIFLTGAIGQAICAFLQAFHTSLRKLLSKNQSSFTLPEQILNKPGWRFALLAFSGLLLLVVLASYLAFQLQQFSLRLEIMRERTNFTGNPNQVGIINRFAQPGDKTTVVYMDETPLYYYLIYGAMHYGAIYYPAIQNTAEEVFISERGQDIDFLVGQNPVFKIANDAAGGVILNQISSITFSGVAPFPINSFDAYIVNGLRSATVSIEWQNGEQTIQTVVTLPEGSANWVHLSQDQLQAERITIRTLDKSTPPISIEGIRFNANSSLQWPWDTGIRLAIKSFSGEETSVDISESELSQGLPFDIDVLDDNGFTVLARVNH